MDSQLNTLLFYIGIIIPTTITVGFFIGFLICWFRCDLKERLLAYRAKSHGKNPTQSTIEKEGDVGENIEKASQHSADSAIDVNELDIAVLHDKDKPSVIHGTVMVLPQSHNNYNNNHSNHHNHHNVQLPMSYSFGLTEAEIHTSLSRGIYPSHEKLNEEIHSEPRIYESQEDIELSIYNGLAPIKYPSIQSTSLTPAKELLRSPVSRPAFSCPRQLLYSSAPRLLNKRQSYSSSIGPIEDNHMTDYGFAPWQQRPNSVCGGSTVCSRAGLQTALSLPKQPQYTPSNVAWNTKFIDGSTNNLSVEILHV